MRSLVITCALAVGCGTSVPLDPALGSLPSSARPRQPPSGWLKGQLHLHSNASGDSETPPQDVARWYAGRGYDFIVFTDHNEVTQIEDVSGMLVFPGVELTQNLPECDPPTTGDLQCLLHVNALVLDPNAIEAASTMPQPSTIRRTERFAYAMDVTEAMGGVAQLNHPNFHYAATADDLLELTRRGLSLFEVANEAWDSNNDGDADHPSTEKMWDTVLSRGGHLYGTATDDAHHYQDAQRLRAAGEPVFTGDRGFVVVRAEKNAASIRAALQSGDFYASNGVLLSDVSWTDGELEVQVSPGTAAPFEVRFIAEGGEVVHTSSEDVAHYDTRRRDHIYVRATVVDADGKRAWVQPVFP